MQTITCNIVTPKKNYKCDDVTSLIINSSKGELTILPGHMDIACDLQAGNIKLHRIEEGWLELKIEKGTSTLIKDNINILTQDFSF